EPAERGRRSLAGAGGLPPAAGAELGERIAASVRAQVSPLPPPGTPAPAYLAAVLAERRGREQAKLLAAAAQHAWAGGQQAPAVLPPGWKPVTGPATASTPGVEEEAQHREPPAGWAGGFIPPV